MSMTKEEAITNLEKLVVLFYTESEQSKMVDYSKIIETLEFAAAALRPITREQVEKMRGEIVETVEKGRMKRVFSCCGCDFTSLTCWITPKFCPSCGAPMTDGAVETIMKRMEEMRNDQPGASGEGVEG